MSYKIWLQWIKSKPLTLKWFPILVLLRPIIDNFYFLKETSPLLSPLYWVGILTPILCIPAIFNKTYFKSTSNTYFNVWSLLILINIIFLFFLPINLLSLMQWLLKITLPVYLMLFIRVFIRTRNDLLGILTTFLYSCIFVLAIFLYELFFNPIKVEYSRGLERIQGGYADIMNYAIYLSFGLLLAAFFYLSGKKNTNTLKISASLLISIYLISFVVAIRISHVATYAVMIMLTGMLFLFLFKQRKGVAVFFIVAVTSLVLYLGEDFYFSKIEPLVATEMEVLEGDLPTYRMFHGRMSRWIYAWEPFSDSGVLAWLIGYSFELENPLFHIGIGIHNDYLRVFFLTGIIGLFIYIGYFLSIIKKAKYFNSESRFLLFGSILILFLYSFSTTPTFYASLLYILFSILSYFSQPLRAIYFLENAKNPGFR
ncbi:MAG TPA: hypothetical protein DDX98_14435 [Bacteroidales bacterium]|nr:hypothetical protein [Bacteroidales bacterium]